MKDQLQKTPITIPTREELYNLAFIYMVVSFSSLVGWAGVEVINKTIFESMLDVDTTLKPMLMIGSVFFGGMAYAFYRKGRTTIFVKPENSQEVVWIRDKDKPISVEEAFRKLQRPGDENDPPLPPGDDPQSKNT